MNRTTKSCELPWDWFLTILWLSIMCLYWTEIIRINFSQNPLFYCADMYSDMMFSVAAWEKASIFPEGWVFGNQYYAVATPVLAALMYGFTHNPCIAMGIASTCMGLSVILSFAWMLGPIFPQRHQRLAAVVLFMTVALWSGDTVYTVNGWQLFFTMCSYYACYAIAAFLSFGCFLRRHSRWSPGFCMMVLIAVLFSFGTGIQSLRQTAIMVIPLIAATGLEQVDRVLHHKPLSRKSILLTGVLSLSNLAGILYANAVSAPKHEIFGGLSFSPIPDLVSSFRNVLNLFGDGWILGIGAITAACVYLVRAASQKTTNSFFTCLFLYAVSTVVVLAIDIFTMMYVRSIYYFLLFPMAVILFVYLFARSKTVSCILAAGILLLSLISGRHSLQSLPSWQDDHPLQAVSDCLEENQVSVVFTQWNLGGKLAIASGFRFQIGFWDAADDVFESVDYLCDPSVFDSDPSDCAYIVSGSQNLTLAQNRARAKGAEIHILKHFPELNLYLFTSDRQLMAPYEP